MKCLNEQTNKLKGSIHLRLRLASLARLAFKRAKLARAGLDIIRPNQAGLTRARLSLSLIDSARKCLRGTELGSLVNTRPEGSECELRHRAMNIVGINNISPESLASLNLYKSTVL